MTQRDRRFATMSAFLVAALAACTTPNPDFHKPGRDAGPDEPGDGVVPGGCAANQALRCDGANVVRCNADGTAEVSEPCALGCSPATLRCATDIAPSNGLAPFLALSENQRDVDLGSRATINTDTGDVKVVGGAVVALPSETLAQDNAPTIRVFMVRSLKAGDVEVRGKNALAIVSYGDVAIGGVFQTASDRDGSPGMFNNDSCLGGKGAALVGTAFARGGAGGGGFGSPGGRGGSATSSAGTADGGPGGAATGNATLIPLRGGCGPGTNAGGAIQLVSRTRIVIAGAVAANGGGGSSGLGGSSGGGILLEAPAVEVEQTGTVVANGGGGGGGGCVLERPVDYRLEGGRLDAIQASGGTPCNGLAHGGKGAAGNADATNGDADSRPTNSFAVAAAGGGGAGRIRINTLPLGFLTAGVISPTPSTGSLATR